MAKKHMVPFTTHLLSSSRYAKQPSKKVFPSIRPQTPFGFCSVRSGSTKRTARCARCRKSWRIPWTSTVGENWKVLILWCTNSSKRRGEPPCAVPVPVFQSWENAKHTTRFFQKKREEGTNKKKWGLQEQEFGGYFLFGTPTLNHFFQWIFGELQPIFSCNDWGVIC